MRNWFSPECVPPLVFGIVVGGLGGVTFGALVSHRVLSAAVHLLSFLGRDHEDELRFDLLLQ